MATKTVKFSRTGTEKLPVNKPVVYRIMTESGKTNYVGIAKRGRVGANPRAYRPGKNPWRRGPRRASIFD